MPGLWALRAKADLPWIISISRPKKFRYAPRIVNGEPVAAKDVLYRFTFELEN